MQNISENGNTSSEGMLPAVARFFSRYDKAQITQVPATVQEMFNDLMLTEHGNDRNARDRWHVALLIICDFGTSIANVQEKDIEHVVETYHVY